MIEAPQSGSFVIFVAAFVAAVVSVVNLVLAVRFDQRRLRAILRAQGHE